MIFHAWESVFRWFICRKQFADLSIRLKDRRLHWAKIIYCSGCLWPDEKSPLDA